MSSSINRHAFLKQIHLSFCKKEKNFPQSTFVISSRILFKIFNYKSKLKYSKYLRHKITFSFFNATDFSYEIEARTKQVSRWYQNI